MTTDPPMPADEARRLATLHDLNILDTPEDGRFDRLVCLASRLIGTPISLISLVDRRRQWFKARVGLTSQETPRNYAFCAHAICGTEVLDVPDATKDPRFAENPLVTDAPHIRAYAGAPLMMENGTAIGTLCAIGREPRDPLTTSQRRILEDLAAVAVDLFELHRTEWAALRRESLFRTALGAISEGFCIRDRSGRLTFFNERYRAFHPAAGDAIVPGVRLEDIVHREAEAEALAEAKADGLTTEATTHRIDALVADRLARLHDPGPPFERRLSDGRHVRIANYPTEDGGAVGVLTDVTDVTRARDALQQAVRTAEDANRAKSRFLAMMSHEIRTPLNGILGGLGLLGDSTLAETDRTLVETARRSAESLLILLNDILDLTKIEAGKLSLEPSAIAPSALIADALSVFAHQASRKGLTVITRLAASLPEGVRGDAGRIRQMLMNFVSNAIKFTETGTITVTATPVAPGVIEFAVADTGIGIRADSLDRLFTEFDQLDDQRTRRFEGSGLGLTITRRLAELMGGSVGVESEPGVGSRFWFRLPLSTCEPPQAAARHRDDGTLLRTRGDTPPRVLLVEDNPANQLITRLMLERLSCRVDVAASGHEAVVAADKHCYDIILMDIAMPGMDGLEATRTIRAGSSAMARVPIIAVTANAFTDDLISYRAAGMDGHITKPIDREVLVQTLVAQGNLVAARNDAISPTGSAPAPTKASTPCPDEKAPSPAALPYADRAPADLLDRSILDDLLAELPDQTRTHILTVFIADCRQRLAALGSPDDPQPIEILRATAHTLKGSTGTYGAAALASCLDAIEQACRDGRTDGLDRLIAQAQDLGQMTLSALDAELAGDAATAAGAGSDHMATGSAEGMAATEPTPNDQPLPALAALAGDVTEKALCERLADDVVCHRDGLQEGLDAGQRDRIVRCSRALLDAAGILGADTLYDAAVDIAEAGDAGDIQPLAGQVVRLIEQANRTLAALRPASMPPVSDG